LVFHTRILVAMPIELTRLKTLWVFVGIPCFYWIN
jgi:hypothetical protein